MIVIYRACSTGNPRKNRPIKGDKLDLVEMCFKSFIRAFKDVDYELICLLDKPNKRLRAIFEGHKTEETFHTSFTDGNVGSFHRQIDLALINKQDFMFVEDDYFWLPGSGNKIVRAIEELSFVTPYDHPGYYNESIHKYPREVLALKDHHWADIMSTTLTFGGKYDSLVKEAKVMRKYGWRDHDMWVDVTTRRKLYAPIPSLATHMETEFLAPIIEWEFANPNQ